MMKQEPQEISISATSKTSRSEPSSRSWREALGLSEFVALDVETTGLDPDRNELIEVGAVLFRSGVEEKSFTSFVKPRTLPDAFITELTGITCADLQDAPELDVVRRQFREFIADYPIVGQNIDFDIGFLSAHFGLEFRFTNRLVLDTAMLARTFFPFSPRFGLASLCRQFGVSLESHHRATADARACAQVLEKIVERLPDEVWDDLAKGLHRVIAPTEHRSVPFFKALIRCAEGIDRPEAPDDQREFIAADAIPDPVAVLDEGGECESALPFFSPRDAQVQMARDVQRALAGDEVLVIEAPTGVGKSLGYLTPALAWALDSEDDERQVVISSHTRALQEQLCSKDLADLELALSGRIRSAVLKGRRNYLCLRRFQALWEDADSRLSDGDRLKLLPLLKWAELTQTGDISEIGAFSSESESLLWSHICSDPVSCSGANCGAHRGDFFRSALDRSQQAHLLFLNHALLTTDAARFLGAKSGTRRLIIDEAHQLERAAVSAATVEFSSQTVRSALSRFTDERANRGLLSKLAREFASSNETAQKGISALDRVVKQCYRASRQAFQSAASQFQPSRNSERIRIRAGSPAQTALASEFSSLISALKEILDLAEDLARSLKSTNESSRSERERLLEFRSAREQLSELLQEAEQILNFEQRVVCWADVYGQAASRSLSLSCAPVNAAEFLSASLWPFAESAVLTSATLTTAGDFGHLTSSLGLSSLDAARLSTKSLPSPFDLPAKMTALCPTFLPETRNATEHLRAVGDLIAEVVSEHARGTLILCTSNAAANELNSRLQPLARKLNRVCLQQTSASQIPELVRSLREERNGILIGSMGLWEGIDVVGDALQILIVVKLPFDVPTEPWIEAKSELITASGGDAFNQFSLPVCTLRLRQGIGRLIRSGEDHGVVVITDSRLVNTRYGSRISQSMPVPVNRVSTTDEALGSIRAHFLEH
ncbi:3'-5' exoribonuclease [bacterium]|nr:3'-5' exoribonuclease [bacterium]